MRQGIGNIWILGLVIGFIFMFTAYIAITINYTAAYKMKKEMWKIIEKHKVITDYQGVEVPSIFPGKGTVTGHVGTLQTLDLYLRGNAYDAKGYCPTDDGGTWIGINSLTEGGGDYDKPALTNKKYYYCIARFKYNAIPGKGMAASYYYKIKLFYRFEIPVLSEWLAVGVDGRTMEIYDVQDSIWG